MHNFDNNILNHPCLDDFFDKYELALYHEIFITWEYNFLGEEIKKSNVIFDIWSHIWIFSLFCFENNPKVKIHSFEASKKNFKKNKILLSKNANEIALNNVFVDYKDGFKEIYINKEKSMQTSFYTNNFLNKSNLKEKIKSINLLDYINFNKLNYKNSIDITKIDIEWYEFDLLLNLDESFFLFTKNLVIEYHLLWKEFEEKYKLCLKKLKKHYKNIEIKKSKYTDKVGLIYCKNNIDKNL